MQSQIFNDRKSKMTANGEAYMCMMNICSHACGLFCSFSGWFSAYFRGDHVVSLRTNFLNDKCDEILRGASIFHPTKVFSSLNWCYVSNKLFEEDAHNFTKRFQHGELSIICVTFLRRAFLQNVSISFYAIRFQKWLRIWEEGSCAKWKLTCSKVAYFRRAISHK